MRKFMSAFIIFMAFLGSYNIFGAEIPKFHLVQNESENEYVMMPLRSVISMIGKKSQIIWDESEKSAVVLMGDRIFKVTAGADDMIVNGVSMPVRIPAEIVEGVLFVELYDLAFMVSIPEDRVKWDKENEKVILNYSGEE